MKLEEAKKLHPGMWLHSHKDRVYPRMSGGGFYRIRVNGKPKTWKTRPEEIKIPVVFGLKGYFYLTERDIGDFEIGDGTMCAGEHNREDF